VGDGDDGAGVVLQVALEPADGLGVQVVRRLVEEQQVRSLEQQPAERDAAALAAREVGHLGVARRQPQGVHRVLHRRVEIPRVGRVDLLLDPRELVGRVVGVVGSQLVEAVEQGALVGERDLDVLADVLRLVQVRLLLEHADGGVGCEAGLAVEVGLQAGHDPQ
jgi:hypothetical protein